MTTSKASTVASTVHHSMNATCANPIRPAELLCYGLVRCLLILAVFIGWISWHSTPRQMVPPSVSLPSSQSDLARRQTEIMDTRPVRSVRYVAFTAQPSEEPSVPGQCSCDPVEQASGSKNVNNPTGLRDPNLSDVWELSSRHLPEKFRCINPLSPGLKALRRTETGWESEDLENALIDDGRLTIVYVHGNFMERNNARERALILNQYLQQRSTRPYRLLMLSWPSTREPHPLRDVYENAESAECQALYVGWLLERLRNHAEVSLLGFSFGARAVTGGLHFAAGGTIPGFQFRSIEASRDSTYEADSRQGAIGSVRSEPRYRVALVAPAVDRSWLTRGGKHATGMESVSGLINLYNSRDPILRRFRFLDRLSRPVAAGFAGFGGAQGFESISNPRSTEPLGNSTKVRQFDCGSVIGTTHSERSYYGQCPYFQLVLDHLLGQESDANAFSE